jgi:hypothetical protein
VRALLVIVVVGLVAASAFGAPAEPLVIMVESHVGPRPGRTNEYLSAVLAGLADPVPLSGEGLNTLVADRLSSRAGNLDAPILSPTKKQVLEAQEDIARARFADGVARIDRLLRQVRQHPAAVAADPRIRRALFEGRLAQLKALLRLRRQGDAEALAIELGRSFPDFAVVERDHGPEVTGFCAQVRRQSWPRGRATLTVATSSPGASVFLNERYVGLSPVRLPDVMPGHYRVMARLGEVQSRVHGVGVLEESVDLRIDLGFDQALGEGGFRFEHEADRLKREPVYALRLARALGATQVITVGLAGPPERPQLAAAVYNVASGTVLRQAAVALGPSPPPHALVVALGRFLRGGAPTDGLIVSTAAPTVRAAALPPLPAADSPPRPGRGLLALSIVGYALAAGAAGAGGYLLSINGRGTCGESRCPETYHTLGAGIGLVVGAAVLAGGATWLLVVAQRRLRAHLVAAPLPRGSVLGLAGAF